MTPCNAITSAETNDRPAGVAGLAACDAASPAACEFECPPKAKHATMSAAKASVFRRLVNSCERLPQRTPRHCKIAKAMVTAEATQSSRPLRSEEHTSELQ